ncbi:hypothetical protein [Ohtaekwangia koreensis]|uniref:SpoIIAA-like n=1 Tax=Ohtaekwangia koreensis TaxID=688867 RepID=A0A1T5KN83_9BACT|nr:hypothetical protein [Ohtaekwangia koreensis]SKC65226.1 hypothetical protein SAMN05660236_2395 [Ohtaekwangia koreensis]
MQTYFERDYYTISYDEVNHILIAKFISPSTSVEYREALGAVIPAIQHFKTGKVIWDVRYLGVISPVDQEWTISNFHNPALKFGYSKAALIMPSDVFTEMSIDGIVSEVGDFQNKYFDNTEAAIDWLKQF